MTSIPHALAELRLLRAEIAAIEHDLEVVRARHAPVIDRLTQLRRLVAIGFADAALDLAKVESEASSHNDGPCAQRRARLASLRAEVAAKIEAFNAEHPLTAMDRAYAAWLGVEPSSLRPEDRVIGCPRVGTLSLADGREQVIWAPR